LRTYGPGPFDATGFARAVASSLPGGRPSRGRRDQTAVRPFYSWAGVHGMRRRDWDGAASLRGLMGLTFAERKATLGFRRGALARETTRRITCSRELMGRTFAERKATIGRRQNPFAERRATMGRTSMAGDCQVRLCGRAEKVFSKSARIAAKKIGLVQIVLGEGFTKNGEHFEVVGLRAGLPTSSSRTEFILLWLLKHKSKRTGAMLCARQGPSRRGDGRYRHRTLGST
jgi:hypothetical protein